MISSKDSETTIKNIETEEDILKLSDKTLNRIIIKQEIEMESYLTHSTFMVQLFQRIKPIAQHSLLIKHAEVIIKTLQDNQEDIEDFFKTLKLKRNLPHLENLPDEIDHYFPFIKQHFSRLSTFLMRLAKYSQDDLLIRAYDAFTPLPLQSATDLAVCLNLFPTKTADIFTQYATQISNLITDKHVFLTLLEQIPPSVCVNIIQFFHTELTTFIQQPDVFLKFYRLNEEGFPSTSAPPNTPRDIKTFFRELVAQADSPLRDLIVSDDQNCLLGSISFEEIINRLNQEPKKSHSELIHNQLLNGLVNIVDDDIKFLKLGVALDESKSLFEAFMQVAKDHPNISKYCSSFKVLERSLLLASSVTQCIIIENSNLPALISNKAELEIIRNILVKHNNTDAETRLWETLASYMPKIYANQTEATPQQESRLEAENLIKELETAKRSRLDIENLVEGFELLEECSAESSQARRAMGLFRSESQTNLPPQTPDDTARDLLRPSQ